ncbi:MAG: ADP-ribosylglycohydrolase family protein [Thermomicrobiales bacterium]
MALDVARSLAAFPDVNMDDMAARFLAWRNSEPKDIGNTTRDALDRMARGVPWDEAGEQAHISRGPRDSAGNGAIMRCAPIAMRFRANPARVRSVSIDVSRITHANPLCTWASVAVDQAIADLLDGAPVDSAITASARGIDDPEVVASIAHAQSATRDETRSGGFVLDTLGAAYWSLSQTDTFEEAVVTAVGLGGDTDTTGAVTGALAGARYGYAAIPERWSSQVQHRNELHELALRLLQSSENR